MRKKTEIHRYSELPASLKDFINTRIHQEFGHIPIVQQYSWAEPDHTILLMAESGDVLTFYNIVLRQCRFDDDPRLIAGINNFITPQEHRGAGYGTDVMKEAAGILFEELSVEYGLLLCADELVPFYSRFGWYKVNSQLYFDQPDGRKQWQANIMLLSRNGNIIFPEKIDLCGLPW